MERPQFQHEIINELYNYNWNLPKTLIQDIIALPRQTLIEDLTKVLKNAIDNFTNYEAAVEDENDERSVNDFWFVHHAMSFLAEVEATEAKGIVERVISCSTDFLEFFLYDYFIETFKAHVLRIVPNDVDWYFKIAENSAIDWIVRDCAIYAIIHKVILGDLDRDEMIVRLGHFFEQTIENNKGKEWKDINESDSEIITFFPHYVISLKAENLKQLVKSSFDEGLATGLYGSYGEFASKLIKKQYPDKKDIFTYQSITEYYNNLNKELSGFSINLGNTEVKKVNNTLQIKTPVKQRQPDTNKIGKQGKTDLSGAFQYTGKKIGRNEPCPCGSGKKYKKCHGKK